MTAKKTATPPFTILRAFDAGEGKLYNIGDEAKLTREQTRSFIVRMAALGYIALARVKA